MQNKIIIMDKNILGLSCVENHVLMYLKNRGEDISCLYADSEIGLKELFYMFFKENQKYEYFSGFPRIQDKLKKLGVLSVELKKSNTEEILQRVEQNRNILFLVKIKAEVFKLMNRQIPWRNDHYMAIEYNDENVILKNDSPLFEIIMDTNEFDNIYMKEYLEIEQTKTISGEIECFLKRNHVRAKRPETWEELCFEGIEYSVDAMKKLRDLIGIYKVSRKRRQLYEREFCDTRYMDIEIGQIEKLYVFTAYMALKDTRNIDDICQIVRRLWEIENNLCWNSKKFPHLES